MIHTKSFVAFLADLEGNALSFFSSGLSSGVFNKDKLNSMLRTQLNGAKFLDYLKRLNTEHLKIVRLYFALDGADFSVFLCGIRIEKYLFLTITFNNKIVIPVFYRELEKYKRKKLYEFREDVIHDHKQYTDVIENDLKVYDELKATIEDLTSVQGMLIDKNLELQDLLTEHKETMALLKKSEEKQRELLNNLDEGIVISDKDGNIIHYNEAYLKIFEFDEEAVKSEKIWNLKSRFVSSLDSDSIKNEVIRKSYFSYFNAPGDIFRDRVQEITIFMPSGKVKTIEEYVLKFEVKDEIFTGFRFKDITEKKEMEDENEIIRQYESSKVFLRGLAHNFNTRFQSVIGNISMAMNYVKDDNKTYTLLKNAIDSFPKINDFSKQLGILSEEGDFKLTRQNIFTLFKEIISENTDKKYTISVDAVDLPPVFCNLLQLKVAIYNIIENSKEAMPCGGVIKISFRKIRYNYCTKYYEKGEPNYLCIDINDEGIGIPSENMTRIFDPFFSTNISQKKGLGLTIAFSIIRRHHGFIRVSSEVGIGTTIMILLPLHDN